MSVARWPRPLSEATMYSAEGVTEKRVRQLIEEAIEAYDRQPRCACVGNCPIHKGIA